ncbi:hypothetical protein BC936DRAFT_149276 [Jimgerdemannia flammicorona]|uniref:Ral GTPase-activating protein subunit alpha/beta N-terminal domain-containing protein n=1 Tax=Jimgerdemannia flammicorona TaxID=994334 RepID=A0A433DK72_9FUNG|nr:hypothetical protein BC936DRAFT_149276 [Jimgerdemannia flammicorona]
MKIPICTPRRTVRDMFLDWIAQLKLLQHDPRMYISRLLYIQTNILAILPLATRKTLISEITTYLHPPHGQPGPEPTLFSSPAHVKWFMEVLGQGFVLPLEDMHITTDDISIYSQWLFEPSHRPVAVRRENLDQEFFQIIFHQFSLLFQPRLSRLPPLPGRPGSVHSNNTTIATMNSLTLPTTLGIPPPAISAAGPGIPPSAQQSREAIMALVIRHVELCKKVLTVFTMAGRTLGSTFTRDTWVVLLKVVLGITDHLLREPMGDQGRNGLLNMGDELCEHFLRVRG